MTKDNFENQSFFEMIFNANFYLEYPYYWVEKDKETEEHILTFSKKPRYTLLETIELKNKMEKIFKDFENKILNGTSKTYSNELTDMLKINK